MKHTKGPWFVGNKGKESGFEINQKERGYYIAETIGGMGPSEEVIANAYLIAAAPELLEVLQKITLEAGVTAHDNAALASAIIGANKLIKRLS